MNIYFDYNNPTTLDTNEKAIDNAIRNIILTQVGTLPGKPTFGSRIKELLFDFIDESTVTLLVTYIIEAITKWEPRINILDVKIKELPEYNKLMAIITYEYKMMGTNLTHTTEINLKD